MTDQYGIQLALPGIPAPKSAAPKAASIQGFSDATDRALTALARGRRPSVLWWWGVRKVGKQTGALCYLCDQPVATWAHTFPVTRQAITAIQEHRAQHWRDVADTVRHGAP